MEPDIIYGIPPFIVEDVTPTLSSARREEMVGWQIRSWMAQKIWSEFGVTGEGVRVGVGDTGVSRPHILDELSGVIEKETFVGDRNPFDRNSHGSHCLSIIGGKDNEEGMIGYAPECEMVSAKVLSDRGSGGSNGIANGIDWMRERGCHIISLSLGSPSPSTAILNAIDRAHNVGLVVFAAAGNDGRSNNIDEPANSGKCVPVGAVDSGLNLARFSDRGRSLQNRGVVAGGVNVYGCGATGYVSMSGTSMATPGAAGQWALYLSAEIKYLGEIKSRGLDAYLKVVNENTVDLGPEGDDVAYGNGAFDVYNAIKKLANQAPEPDPDPTPNNWETVYTDLDTELRKKK